MVMSKKIRAGWLGQGSAVSERDKSMNTSIDDITDDVLFVIPSINGAHLLERMLPTVDLPADRIVVLDQDSSDRTEAVCRKFSVQLRQLGRPHSYTECCNIALDLADENRCKFVYISNNDIIFVTSVARELYKEISRDSSLAILSPSQVIKGGQADPGILSNRVYWELDQVSFEHDTTTPIDQVFRLESDFCELTCAIVKVEAAREIGGFDNEFAFYHEDADFGFRLRQANYVCAYLPQSQIIHFANSTFNVGKQESRLSFIRNSRKRFARKHLGYGLNYRKLSSEIPTSWNIVNRYLYPYLFRAGLIDTSKPELLFAHPGIEPFEYLYTVWETSRLPEQWLDFKRNYSSVYVPSQWNKATFENDGYENVRYVPLGVETDVYKPWGPIDRQFDQKTFLWFSRDQYRKGLDVMLSVWDKFRKKYPRAHLIILGHNILERSRAGSDPLRQTDKFLMRDLIDENIIYKEIRSSLSPEEVAALYRGVDAIVLTSRSEGFGFSVAEGLACGTQVIFPNYGASEDMLFQNSVNFGGDVVKADYSDKNYFDVGEWWEPRQDEILSAMIDVMEADESSRVARAQSGIDMVRSRFTWRDTVFSIYNDLRHTQRQSIVDYRYPGGVFSEKEARIVGLCMRLDRSESARIGSVPGDQKDFETIFRDFDQDYYFENNSDVRSELIDPLGHFVLYGWLEDRRPAHHFDCATYLTVCSEARQTLLALHQELDADRNARAMALFRVWRERKARALISSAAISDAEFLDEVIKLFLDGRADENWKNIFKQIDCKDDAKRASFVDRVISSEHYTQTANRVPRYPGSVVRERSLTR